MPKALGILRDYKVQANDGLDHWTAGAGSLIGLVAIRWPLQAGHHAAVFCYGHRLRILLSQRTKRRYGRYFAV